MKIALLLTIEGIVIVRPARDRQPATADFGGNGVISREAGFPQRRLEGRLRCVGNGLGEAVRCVLLGSRCIQVSSQITDLFIRIGISYSGCT